MSLRHLIAEQVLLEGELVPAHLEIGGEGTIRSIQRLTPGALSQRAAVVRAREVSAGAGMRVLHPRMVVLPGVVDTNVSFSEPGHSAREGFATGTMAAALGGVTTVVDMPQTSVPATVSTQALQLKSQAAAPQAFVDVGFWAGLVPGSTDLLLAGAPTSNTSAPTELEALWEAGALGFVCTLLPLPQHIGSAVSAAVTEFPAVTPAQLREAMTRIAAFGGLVAVHAEDARTVDLASRAAGALSTSARGSADMRRYKTWAAARPAEAEVTAVEGLLDAVRETGCRTHILHLASAAALELIAAAKDEGLPVTAETCPHYLCFTADSVPDSAPEFVCWPPLRDAANREGLWQGLEEGIIDAVVSGHAPATWEEKHRRNGDLRFARPGISGLQVGFAALASEARTRGIGLAEVSRWTAQSPAAIAGLHQKGEITPGRHADLLIYDPESTHVVSAAGLAHKNPASAYEGMEIHGAVAGAVLRGHELFTAADSSATLAQNGQLLSGPGAGYDLGPGPTRVGTRSGRGYLRAVVA